MITPDKRIIEDNHVNLTDYTLKCPEGMRSFFSFIVFTDDSCIHLSNIFAKDRASALKIVLDRFADCFGYIYDISLQASDREN